jgi:hypothetical protein
MLAIVFDNERGRRTIVDRLKLGDDVQADVRELVLEHLQEHGQEM